MRRFLHIAVLCLIPTIALASTFTRPYGASDYAGVAKAVGTKVNAEFAYIASWLAGGNIATGNIANLGVSNSNLALPNIKFTGETGTFFVSGATTLRQITNLSTTITTVGRPVEIRLQSVATTIGSGDYGYFYTAGGTGEAHLFLINGSATVMSQWYTNLTGEIYRCSDFSYIDYPSAGTQTYSVKLSQTENVPNFAFTMGGCKLVVREL